MTHKYAVVAGIGLLLASLSAPVLAELAVIVHPSFAGSSLAKAEFANLYLGRTTKFPDGSRATPLDVSASKAKSEMLSDLLGKTEEQFVHIWARLVFSGNANSLERVADDKAMVDRVAGDPSAIGYVDASAVNNSVKVLSVK